MDNRTDDWYLSDNWYSMDDCRPPKGTRCRIKVEEIIERTIDDAFPDEVEEAPYRTVTAWQPIEDRHDH